MAERERRMREAEEAGRRQVEEQQRLRNDEVFRQVLQVRRCCCSHKPALTYEQTHTTTIDSFLEDIVLQAQDNVADDQGASKHPLALMGVASKS